MFHIDDGHLKVYDQHEISNIDVICVICGTDREDADRRRSWNDPPSAPGQQKPGRNSNSEDAAVLDKHLMCDKGIIGAFHKALTSSMNEKKIS